ncbi:MAG: hypothetical protein NTY22_01490 [Proteobacteria bacterium]|nr:hypothetical protein [Pseudomonadota bacterium]
MLFSIKYRILVIGMVMLISGGLAAASNPFSVTLETEKKDIEGETAQVLKINISSRSIEEAKYQLILDIPKGNISVLEGKKVYSGVLGPLKSEDFYISLKLVSPGENEIRARVYNYIDDRELDIQNVRIFYSKYSVTKNVNPAQGAYVFSMNVTSEKTDAEKKADSANTKNINTVDQAQAMDQNQPNVVDDQSKQKFVVNPKNRYNNFIRGLLFVLSFFIIGWLAYKIMNKKS